MSFRITRRAQASWQGPMPDGGGRIALGSGAYEGPFTLKARVEDVERSTNPEELIGAANAGCYTMSLANLLTEKGHPPTDLQTEAKVRLEADRLGFLRDADRAEHDGRGRRHRPGDLCGARRGGGADLPDLPSARGHDDHRHRHVDRERLVSDTPEAAAKLAPAVVRAWDTERPGGRRRGAPHGRARDGVPAAAAVGDRAERERRASDAREWGGRAGAVRPRRNGIVDPRRRRPASCTPRAASISPPVRPPSCAVPASTACERSRSGFLIRRRRPTRWGSAPC